MGQIISELFVHPAIMDGIAKLERRGSRKIQKLKIDVDNGILMERQSVSHLVWFMRRRRLLHLPVTQLELHYFKLNHSDGGLDVLRNFFANDTTLTTVKLISCYFGNTDETLRLFAAIQTNTSLTDLTIEEIENLQGAALGNCLSSLLQNNVTLQRLELGWQPLEEEAIRAFQSSLQSNRHLKELHLSFSGITDEGLCLIVDALVGNPTLEVLDISCNQFTSNCLDDITTLVGSSQLKEINLSDNLIFENVNDTHQFAHALSRNKFLRTLNILTLLPIPELSIIFQSLESNKTLEHLKCGRFAYNVLDYRINNNPTEAEMAIFMELERRCSEQIHLTIAQLTRSLPRMKGIKQLTLHGLQHCIQHAAFSPALHKSTSLQQLPGLDHLRQRFPQFEAATITIYNILRRNCYLAHADSLLALQPTTGMLIDSNSGIWHAALVKLASIPGHNNNNNSINTETHTTISIGASAIFKIFKARPALLLHQSQVLSSAHLLVQQSHDSSRESTQERQQDGPANDIDNNAARRPIISTCGWLCLIVWLCRRRFLFGNDNDDE